MTMLEKFNQLEVKYNKSFLIYMHQIMQIVDEDDDPKNKRQLELLASAYEHWYSKIQEDPRCMESCVSFYKAVGDGHELLMKRDEQIFTLYGDFLGNAFEAKGVDTKYIVDQLGDGLDPDAMNRPEEERDAKENFWSATISLYRLAAMICIYLKMPVVREIIDLILLDNPDLNQSNMFSRIFSKFKGSKRLRKLIMKLMKSKDDNFAEIFTSLQKVIATFSSEVSIDSNMQTNLETAQKQVRATYDSLLTEANVGGLTDEQKTQLIDALEEKNSLRLADLLEEKVISEEQLKSVQALYKQKGLDKMQVNKTVKDLGRTMEDMMAAIQSNDESKVQQILSRSNVGGLNLPPEEIARMQSEMEQLEEEDNEEDASIAELD